MKEPGAGAESVAFGLLPRVLFKEISGQFGDAVAARLSQVVQRTQSPMRIDRPVIAVNKNPLRIFARAGILLGSMTDGSALLTTILGFAGAALLCAVPEIGLGGLALAAVSALVGGFGLAALMANREEPPAPIERVEHTIKPDICNDGPRRTHFRERLLAQRIMMESGLDL